MSPCLVLKREMMARSHLGMNAAIARFEKRLKIDRHVQKKLKKVAKTLNIEI